MILGKNINVIHRIHVFPPLRDVNVSKFTSLARNYGYLSSLLNAHTKRLLSHNWISSKMFSANFFCFFKKSFINE